MTPLVLQLRFFRHFDMVANEYDKLRPGQIASWLRAGRDVHYVTTLRHPAIRLRSHLTWLQHRFKDQLAGTFETYLLMVRRCRGQMLVLGLVEQIDRECVSKQWLWNRNYSTVSGDYVTVSACLGSPHP